MFSLDILYTNFSINFHIYLYNVQYLLFGFYYVINMYGKKFHAYTYVCIHTYLYYMYLTYKKKKSKLYFNICFTITNIDYKIPKVLLSFAFLNFKLYIHTGPYYEYRSSN